jgi:hypothetical protein
MTLRKRLAFAALTGAVLFVAVVAFFEFTFPWEVTWVRSATSLTLREPDETRTAGDLQNFLAGFESDNWDLMGFRCTLSERNGHIRVNGATYPIEFVKDKWLGDVLLVHRGWKTLLVHRRWKNPG